VVEFINFFNNEAFTVTHSLTARNTISSFTKRVFVNENVKVLELHAFVSLFPYYVINEG